MLTYSGVSEQQINSRQQKVINKNIERISNIRSWIGISPCCSISKTLVTKYTDAAERCLNELSENSVTTIASVSNLRFLFELCVHTRLLNKESSYKFKVYYSLYQSQLKKSENMIEYIKTDLDRINKLKREEEKLSNGHSIEEKMANFVSIDKLYDDIDEEISLFLNAIGINGAGFHIHDVEKYSEKLKDRHIELVREWENAKNNLIQDKDFKKAFGFSQQPVNIEKLLEDKRNWKKKAIEVELNEIYTVIYDYTSSLIHSGSYSIMIPNQLEQPEVIMIRSLSTRLASDILKGLMTFAFIPNVKIINYE